MCVHVCAQCPPPVPPTPICPLAYPPPVPPSPSRPPSCPPQLSSLSHLPVSPPTCPAQLFPTCTPIPLTCPPHCPICLPSHLSPTRPPPVSLTSPPTYPPPALTLVICHSLACIALCIMKLSMHPPYCVVQRKLTPSQALHHPLASTHMTSGPAHLS